MAAAVVYFVLAAVSTGFGIRARWTAERLYRGRGRDPSEVRSRDVRLVRVVYAVAAVLGAILGVGFATGLLHHR